MVLFIWQSWNPIYRWDWTFPPGYLVVPVLYSFTSLINNVICHSKVLLINNLFLDLLIFSIGLLAWTFDTNKNFLKSTSSNTVTTYYLWVLVT